MELKQRILKAEAGKESLFGGRQVFYHFAVIYTGMTLLQIGDYIGGRDHTTVIHGKQTVKDMIETYPDKIKELKEIEYMICFSSNYWKLKITALRLWGMVLRTTDNAKAKHYSLKWCE